MKHLGHSLEHRKYYTQETTATKMVNLIIPDSRDAMEGLEKERVSHVESSGPLTEIAKNGGLWNLIAWVQVLSLHLQMSDHRQMS